MRGNINDQGGGSLDVEVCDTASVVAVPPVMCSGLLNTGNVNGVGTSSLRPQLWAESECGMKYRYKVRIGT